MANILVVLSGADPWTRVDGTEHPTGYWAEEFAVIHEKFVEAGANVDLATPEGRKPTADPRSLDPDIGGPDTPRFAGYLDSVSESLDSPLKLSDVDIVDYDAALTPGTQILDARQGLFEYQSVKYEEVEGPRARGLRLFHVTRPDPRRPRKFGCQYDDNYYSSPRSEYTIRSIHLTEMMGPEGLQFFLRLISVGELPTDEVFEMIRRIHVPGYEHARLHFEEAKDTGVIFNDHDLDMLSQATIEKVLGHASRFEDCGLCPPSRP